MIRFTTHRFTTTALAVAAVLLAAVPAHAGFRSGVASISAVPQAAPATIVVYNDGNQFTHVTQSHLEFRALTSVQCKSRNDLMDAILAVGSVSTASGQLGSPQGPWSRVTANGGGGSPSVLQAHLNDLFAAPKKNPAQLCNAELDKQVAAGASRFDLLQHGFDLLMRYDLTFLANCKYTGVGIGAENDTGGTGPANPMQWPNYEWDGWGSAGLTTYGTVHCNGGHSGSLTTRPAPPRPSTNDLAVPFQVTRAALVVSPKSTTTQCPATLTANGSITVVGEGTVQYRVEHNGALGPVQQMHFGPGDPKGKALAFQLQVGQPANGELGKAGDSGGSGRGVGGFTTPQQPKDKVSGSLRLIIVSPKAGVDHSNPTGYNVTCSSPVPPGPTTLTGSTNPTHGRQ